MMTMNMRKLQDANLAMVCGGRYIYDESECKDKPFAVIDDESGLVVARYTNAYEAMACDQRRANKKQNKSFQESIADFGTQIWSALMS